VLESQPWGKRWAGGVGAKVLEYRNAGLLLEMAIALDLVRTKAVKQEGQIFACTMTALF